MNNETEIISALILGGDLAKLSQSDKVKYYNGYCQRLGLDAFTKPFDILKLNGREILYCTRSGSQQLNKLHQVSHSITSRELIPDAGVYQVTSKASLPDGRFTESIGAVTISGLKNDAYANAIMKAETKAKRRATLDLLGLGVLDETEVESIASKPIIDKAIEIIPETDTVNLAKKTYQNLEDVIKILNSITSIQQLRFLYQFNAQLVEGNKELKSLFTNQKNKINEQSNGH